MISYWLAVILFVLGWIVVNVLAFNLPALLKRPSWENTTNGVLWFVVCFLGLGVGLIVYWQYIPAVYLIQKGGREYYYDTFKLLTSSKITLSNKKEATVDASIAKDDEPDIVINDTPQTAYVDRYTYSSSFTLGDPYSKNFLPYEISSTPEVDYFGKDKPPSSVSTQSGGTITHHWLFVKGENAEP